MTATTAWRWCAVAGVVAFLCSWGFGRIPGLVACGPTGGLGPILAFEFVASPADVAALFGAEPCRSNFVGAQKIGLVLDALVFIPAYTTFLILAAMASARITNRWPPVAMVVAACIGAAGLCDEIEGVLLYLIVADLPGSQALIDALWWPVHIKFALLALGTFGIGVSSQLPRWWAGGFAGIVGYGSLIALHRLVTDPAHMMIGFTLSWAAILLCAFAGCWRPSLFSALDVPPPAPGSPTA